MTLLIETKVNGALVGRGKAENIRQIGDGKCVYSVKYEQFGRDGRVFDFDVIHDREERMEVLISLIYEGVIERLK